MLSLPRNHASPLLLACIFAVAPLCPSLDAGPQEATAEEMPTPEFRSARKREKEYFEQALEEFRAGEYKDALGHFKKSSRGAADKDSKAIIEKWLVAATGGLEMQKIDLVARRGNRTEAYFASLSLADKYAGTPIVPKLREYSAKLEGEVLVVVEDFERADSTLTKKYGKERIVGSGKAFHGESCIRWAQTPDKKGFQLKRSRVPKNWSQYEAVVFYLQVETGAEIEIIARTPGSEGKQLNAHVTKFKAIKKGRGWTRAIVPMKDFKKYGKGDLKNVESLILQVPPTKNFALHLDYICLIKKGKASPASRSRR